MTGIRNGAAYTSYAERLGLWFGDAARAKTVRGLTVRVEGAIGAKVQFEVGGTMNPEQAVQWSAPVTYTVGQTANNELNLFATGRYIALRITSLDNQPWRITSIDIDFVMAGRY